MQNERSTRRRKKFADNFYERATAKGERRYEVGYADAHGAWRMKTLRARTRTEAKAERDEFLAKQRRGEIAVPMKLTVAECVVDLPGAPRFTRCGW
jgi:hypothetical protein